MASHGTAGSLDFDDVLSLSSTVYARVSSELVHSSLDLGKHALIVNKPQQYGFTIQSVTILAQHVFVGGISAASSGHDPFSLSSTVLLSLCVVLNRSLYL